MADVSLMAVPSKPQDGTTCASCGAEVVADQRYCLSCGHPVSPVRLGFLDVLQDQGTHPAPQWSSPTTLEATPVGYGPPPERGLGGWIRRNGAVFGLLAVLLLCLIAGLLLGHWASGGGGRGANTSTVKVEGLSGAALAPATSTTPSTATPLTSSAAAAAAKAKKEHQQAAKEAAKETKAEQAPPPKAKKVSHQEAQKLSKTTGKKHAEEVAAKGAEPFETP